MERRWGGALLAYACFAAITCGLGLGSSGLISMEGMVVDGAARMLDAGEWAVPYVYGELYTFKPALAYWLSAAAQAIDPAAPEWVLRLPFAATGALAGLAVLWLVGVTATPRAGLVAALATVGTALFVEKVRLAEYDTPLAAGVAVAVVAAGCNLASRRQRTALWWAAYAGLTFAFLAKGTPALMAYLPGLLLAAATHRRLRSLWAPAHLLPCLTGVAAIGAYLWWAVATAGVEVFDQPLLEARWRGAGWSLEAVGTSIAKPLLIVVAFLPWSLALIATRRGLRELDPLPRRLLVSGLAFLVAGVATFAAVAAHEMRYYLPLVPGVALVVAALLGAERPVPRSLAAASRALFALSCVLLVGVAVHSKVASTVAVAAALALLALGWMAAERWRAASPARATVRAMVATSVVLAIAQGWVLLPRRAAGRDLKEVADQMRPHLPPGTRLWVAGPADLAGKHASLFHYLEREVRTFAPREPVPAGAAVLLVGDLERPPVPGGCGEELTRATSREWIFALHREPATRSTGGLERHANAFYSDSPLHRGR